MCIDGNQGIRNDSLAARLGESARGGERAETWRDTARKGEIGMGLQ